MNIRLEPATEIEGKVGALRAQDDHLGRAVSAEQRVYVLHSAECVGSGIDLRECEYSRALSLGIETNEWSGAEDRAVLLEIDEEFDDLVPARNEHGVIVPATSLPARIGTAILDAQLQYISEDQLQQGIAAALAGAGIAATREVRLSDGVSRIDLLAGDVGIEVKIDGRTVEVARQLARYAQCPEISTVVLVTTRARHAGIPDQLAGKPVIVCSLIGGGL